MTAQDSDTQRRTPQAVFATVAIACFSYSAVAVALMHVLRPDLAPASSEVSEYALGRYGWIMACAFLAMGIGCLMLMLGLVRIGIRSWIVRLGAGLLGVEFLGSLVGTIFPTDLPGGPSTLTGRIHDLNFLVGIGSFSLALLLLSCAGSSPVGSPEASRGFVSLSTTIRYNRSPQPLISVSISPVLIRRVNRGTVGESEFKETGKCASCYWSKPTWTPRRA